MFSGCQKPSCLSSQNCLRIANSIEVFMRKMKVVLIIRWACERFIEKNVEFGTYYIVFEHSHKIVSFDVPLQTCSKILQRRRRRQRQQKHSSGSTFLNKFQICKNKCCKNPVGRMKNVGSAGVSLNISRGVRTCWSKLPTRPS